MKSRSEDARPAPTTRRACLLRLAAAGPACIAAAPFQVKATPLARVRERGTLSVGVYQDMPHVFVQLSGFLDGGKKGMAESCEALREAFAA